MIAAAAALFGSELVVGGRAYVVRPPSVLTALAVTAAVEHDVSLLPEACAGPDARGRPWMPPSMRSVLFSRSVRPAERRRVILTAMLAGVPDEQLERAARQQAEAGAEAARDGWEAVLARYQATYAVADVLALPWPFFLAMSDEIRRERAREAIDWATGYAAVRAGEEAWASLLREAGYPARTTRPSGTYRPRTEEERAEAEAQRAMVRAQLRAKRETGSTLAWREFMSPPTGEA